MDNIVFNVYDIIDNKKRKFGAENYRDFGGGMFIGWIHNEYLYSKAVERYELPFINTYDENIEDVFKQMRYELDITHAVLYKYAQKKYEFSGGQVFSTVIFFAQPISAIIFDQRRETIDDKNRAVIASTVNIDLFFRHYNISIENKSEIAFCPDMLTKKQKQKYKVFLQ